MYNVDNDDRIVMSFHGGDAQGGNAANNPKNAPWVEGWLDWGTSPDNTNILFLINEKYSKLAKYFGNTKNLLKCPADHYLSQAQRKKGWTERVRSVSGNIGIGDGNAEGGPFETIYKHIKKVGDFAFPDPLRPGSIWTSIRIASTTLVSLILGSTLGSTNPPAIIADLPALPLLTDMPNCISGGGRSPTKSAENKARQYHRCARQKRRP